jgi:long-subunit acyl-CoA synthetase (AMP-forming)
MNRNQIESAMKSPESMWKLAKWARKRGETTTTTTPALNDPTTNITYEEARDKAHLLKNTFFQQQATSTNG